MPDLQNKDVVAILCSDIHLSIKPPVCRSIDVDWFDTMAYYLTQLNNLAEEHAAPVICAGDIFDKWNAPAELINFALAYLPDEMYAVPGQHDLPAHNYDEMNRSAYGTLVEAGKIINLEPGKPQYDGDLALHGFPWGTPITPLREKDEDFIHLAVIHQYAHKGKSTSYPGAPADCHVKHLLKQLDGFDAAVFGDNHIHWLRNGSR